MAIWGQNYYEFLNAEVLFTYSGGSQQEETCTLSQVTAVTPESELFVYLLDNAIQSYQLTDYDQEPDCGVEALSFDVSANITGLNYIYEDQTITLQTEDLELDGNYTDFTVIASFENSISVESHILVELKAPTIYEVVEVNATTVENVTASEEEEPADDDDEVQTQPE